MTVYNLITPLHRFVIERSADLLVGSRPCGFHCVEMAPRVAASYHGIFRTELLVSRALRVGNSIKSKRLKFLGSIRVHFLTYNFGRPIELWMLLLLQNPGNSGFWAALKSSILLLDQVREITTRKTCMVTHVFINVHFLSCQKSNCLLILHHIWWS